jgi:hypothetical protein
MAMGRYDHISDKRLCAEVARYGRLLQRMEERGEVLDRTADILTILGELRQMVFAWEISCTYGDDLDDGERDTA